MSYTMEFWALSVDDLTTTDEVAPLLSGGGGPAAAEQVGVVMSAVRRMGFPVGSLDHSSSGGTWFRDEFMAGPVAATIGPEPTAHLLDRPINRLTWSGYPSLGWLTHAEITAALTRSDNHADAEKAEDSEEADLLATILTAFHTAADRKQDIVTIYT
ncbi:MAG TPA: hypothetical protein VH352_12475 [Pseudonocardiaceae bacterium]|nr:hypothetical protein [Pseudonocardiaceae bacterium]